MKFIVTLLTAIILFSCQRPVEKSEVSPKEKYAPNPFLVIHAGAGSMKPGQYTLAEEKQRDSALHQALEIGVALLEEGKPALTAVEHVIVYLEDCPYFNAGKGSFFNADGEVENDASIMDGTSLEAGAVAGIKNVKNPISLARLIKDSTDHVMLGGSGASAFADEMGLERVPQNYFFTERRLKQRQDYLNSQKMGTVGCVALDVDGNIAAGTSTGGMMYKKFGRIGDSPIIGAGTYADSRIAGVSCTGHGEYFIKNAVAYDLIARMEYTTSELAEAARTIIHDKLKAQHAGGGLIAVDKFGNVTMPFNTEGMFRGYKNPDTTVVLMYE